MISLDTQNNDQKVSDCLYFTSSLFILLTTLTQFIHLKSPLHILNHVSHSHLLMSSRIKHYWFFQFFWNGDLHIFPQKDTCGLKVEIFTAIVSQTFKVFDITIINIMDIWSTIVRTRFQNVLYHWSVKIAVERNG